MNNLPMKKEVGIIGRIKNFFRKLFYLDNNRYIEQVDDNSNKNKESILDNLKVEVSQNVIKDMQKQIKREELLDMIYENPKLLDNLAIEELDKIAEYYDISIKDYEEKIKKLQTTN